MADIQAAGIAKLKDCTICKDLGEKVISVVPEEYREDLRVSKKLKFSKNIFE